MDRGHRVRLGRQARAASRRGYDVCGDGRMKVFGSWGRYYDWTKYELPRGSFGAETWCIYYRGARHAGLRQPEPDQHAGTRSVGHAGQLPRPPRSRREVDPDIKPMKQDSTSVGIEYQLGRDSVLTAHYIHNDLRETIEDIGFLNASGDEGYMIGNPGRGLDARCSSDRAARRPGSADAAAEAPVRRARARLQPAVRQQLVLQRQLQLSRLYGNYAGLASLRRDHARRRPAAARPPRSSRPAASPARAATPTAPGTSTSSCGIRTATSTCSAAWPPIVRTS